MAQGKKMNLTTQIFIGLILGAIFGYILPDVGAKLKPIGDAFIRMIKMIVVPLIFSTLIMGIAGTGDFKKLGRLGGKAIIWFECATTVALIVGLGAVNLIQPGVGVNIPIPADAGAATAAAAKKSINMVQYVLHIIPTNVIDGMARGDMLQMIFFTCFFGVGVAHIGKDAHIIVDMARSVAETMFKVTHYVMRLAPIGIFAMIAYTVGNFGLSMMIPLIKLVVSLYGAIIVFLAILVLCASLITRVNFLHIVKGLKDPLLLAYSTASSEAALPLAMDRLGKLGVPEHVYTFVLPTGYSFNLDGSTLYSSLAVVFIAQMYGIPFTIEHQVLMLLTLMLSTKGIAGVPGASIIVIAGTAVAFGLPAEGVAIILGVDRIMDMMRTFCNVFGNCVATVVVCIWEKEATREQLSEAYHKNFGSGSHNLPA